MLFFSPSLCFAHPPHGRAETVQLHGAQWAISIRQTLVIRGRLARKYKSEHALKKKSSSIIPAAEEFINETNLQVTKSNQRKVEGKSKEGKKDVNVSTRPIHTPSFACVHTTPPLNHSFPPVFIFRFALEPSHRGVRDRFRLFIRHVSSPLRVFSRVVASSCVYATVAEVVPFLRCRSIWAFVAPRVRRACWNRRR